MLILKQILAFINLLMMYRFKKNYKNIYSQIVIFGAPLIINTPNIGKLSMYAPGIKKVIADEKERRFVRKGANIIIVEGK